MKPIIIICTLLIVGCAANKPIEKANKYTPPKDRVLYDPKIVDGELLMSREQWFHNFKASAIPGLCSAPQAGFLRVYNGAPENCEKTVEPILDFCFQKFSNGQIPETVRGMARANAYGQRMGMCLLINYQQKQ